jgi:hypothetical protein
LQKQLDSLQTRKKRIYEMREYGMYNKQEFQERKEEIENEIAAAKISLSEARIDQSCFSHTASHIRRKMVFKPHN